MMMAAAGISWVLAGPREPRLLVVPLAVIAFGVLQLIPLPGSLLCVVSPLAFQSQKALQSLYLSRPWPCVSLYPGATLAELQQLVLLATTILVVGDVARVGRFRRAIAWTLGAIGLVVWLLGMCFGHASDHVLLGFHDMKGPLRHYKTPLLPPVQTAGFSHPDVVSVGEIEYEADGSVVGDGFGPYVVSNHFAGCLGLTLPVALGLFLALSRGAVWARRFVYGMALLGCGAALFTVGISAGSRAGAAALAIGFLVVASLHAGRTWVRAAWLSGLGLVLAGMALILLVALRETAGQPAASDSAPPSDEYSLRSVGRDVRERITVARAALMIFRESPWLGAGLGTYGKLHCPIVRKNVVWHFAHNDYAQLLVEGGAVGVTGSAGLIAFTLRRIHTGWRRRVNAREQGMAAGLAGALAAIAVHSCFDWNLHVPANAYLFAIVVGLAIGTGSRCGTYGSNETLPPKRGLRARIACAILVTTMLGCIVLAISRIRSEPAMMALRRAVALQRDPKGEGVEAERVASLRSALAEAEGAVKLAPLNADDATTIGQAYLHLSKGQDRADLMAAYQWFCRSQRLCPVDEAVRATTAQLRAVLVSTNGCHADVPEP
jgi:hypothetical protein